MRTQRPPCASLQYLECFTPWLARDPGGLALPTNGSRETMVEHFAHQFLLHETGLLRLAFVDPGATVLGWPAADGTPARKGSSMRSTPTRCPPRLNKARREAWACTSRASNQGAS